MLVELLTLPFLQRALVAGLLLSFLMGIMGVLTLVRKSIFYGDAIAHSSLAGVALGLAFGVYPLAAAVVYSIGVALLIPYLRKKVSLSTENTLGILLPVSMGLGVIIFSLLPGYQPQMMSFLFGNVLTIQLNEVWLLFILFFIALVVFTFYLLKIVLVSIDEEYATLLGLPTKFLERIYEILLAVVIIAGVKLLGVVLVNALLIIPASTTKSFVSSMKQWLVVTPIVSIVTVVGGIVVSVLFNTPPGATIAVCAGGLFLLAQIVRSK